MVIASPKKVKRKEKTVKVKRKIRTKKSLGSKEWQKVKLKGNVITEDGGGFEGLIGLEVLEDYDPQLVKAGNKRSFQKKEKRKELVGKKRRNSEDSSDEEKDENQSGKSKKQRKLEKFRAKRAKKKLKKKEKSKAKMEEGLEVEDASDNEYPADRFAFIRPPPSSDSDSDEAPSLVEINDESTLNIDDLEGWNGFGIPQAILRALAEKGFKSPTEIQKLTLPAAILGKKDILGAAETGSGKTLAFGIPVIAGIMELKSRNVRSGIRKAPKSLEGNNPTIKEDRETTPDPEELEVPEMGSDAESTSGIENEFNNAPLYAVVLTPTRELAVQVRDHLVASAKYTGIKIAAIFGGLSVAKQERLLRKSPEIVVATPGRLWELYQQDNPHLRKISDISFLVIDETDRMVEKGHFEELKSLLKVLNADDIKKKCRQNFVFSATLTLVHDLPEHMQKRNTGKRPRFVKQTSSMKIQSLIEELGISQPKIVDITRSQQTAQTLTECRLICAIDHKDYYLYYFIERHPGRSIVFCNSIDCVKRLATLFGLLDCNPLPLHANMIQKQRLKNLERFRDNPIGLLIATDVAARGLDIPNVDHVIHYQVPRTSENYVHRSGRTARANKDGITLMFMEPGEVKNYVKLYKTLDRSEDLPLFPVAERYLDAVKERVNLAREVDKQELKLKRAQTEIGWMKKHAEEMDIIIDGFNDVSDSDADEDPFMIEKRKNRLNLANTRMQLKSLLAKPIFPRGFSFKYPTMNSELQNDRNHLEAHQEENSAVKAVKDAVEEIKLAKKMRNKKKNSS